MTTIFVVPSTTVEIMPSTLDAADDEESTVPPAHKSANHTVSNPIPDFQVTPPPNFNMVAHNLFRSSFPQKENFSFLRRLKLKSVLYVPHISAQPPPHLLLAVNLFLLVCRTNR